MRRFRARKLNQGGDTIVEVMIVLAVLGLSFGISYATANQGLHQSQNANEHSRALGLLDAQVEMLRAIVPSWNGTIPASINSGGTAFCMVSSSKTSIDAGQSFTSPVPASYESDNFSEYPTDCQQPSNAGFNYDESIVYQNTGPDASNPYFDFRVRWPGIGTLGNQQEEVSYKIQPISLSDSSGITLGSDNGSIYVYTYNDYFGDCTVAGTPSSCPPSTNDESIISTLAESGVTITVTGPGGYSSTQQTNSNGSVNFANLQVGPAATYTVTESGYPGGYTAKPSSPVSVTLTGASPSASIDFGNSNPWQSQTLAGNQDSSCSQVCGTQYNATIGGTTYTPIGAWVASYLCGLPYAPSDNPYVNPNGTGPNECQKSFATSYNFVSSYKFLAVRPTTDSNGYSLTINYSNINDGPPPPSSEYGYQITITDNNSSTPATNVVLPPPTNSVTTSNLPASQYATKTINLPSLINLSDQPITLTWSNDMAGGGYDANFQINYVTLTPN